MTKQQIRSKRRGSSRRYRQRRKRKEREEKALKKTSKVCTRRFDPKNKKTAFCCNKKTKNWEPGYPNKSFCSKKTLSKSIKSSKKSPCEKIKDRKTCYKTEFLNERCSWNKFNGCYLWNKVSKKKSSNKKSSYKKPSYKSYKSPISKICGPFSQRRRKIKTYMCCNKKTKDWVEGKPNRKFCK